MDLDEECYNKNSANMREINVLANVSVGSPSISPVFNNAEFGVHTNEVLSPKSIGSWPNHNFDEEVENNYNLGISKEEDNGRTGFVNDYKLHVITEGSNERNKSPSISLKVDENSKPVKGYGLKKWRRIKRDLPKYTSVDANSLTILKRPHSNDEEMLETPKHLDFDIVVDNSAFSIGTADLESNDDKSSNSSSMASVNKITYEIGYGKHRSWIKNIGSGQGIRRGVGNVKFFDSCLLKEENKSTKKNVQLPLRIDHFVDSVTILKAAQEALEAEIRNFGDISKSVREDNIDFNVQFEATEFNNSPKFDGQICELNNKIEHLNYKLEAASAVTNAKEARVTELENTINKASDTELEVEDLIKKKLETEIVCLIIDRYTQNWKIHIEDQISTVFSEQTSMHLSNAEGKATDLKGEAEELDCYYKELLGSRKVLKLKSRIHKISLCSFIQLIMLCIALGRFLVQLMPPFNEFVPT